jgi:hypothetical protein
VTTFVMPICMGCQHLTKDGGWGYRCSAFPAGIPGEIMESRVDHREPVDGDRGIRFIPIEDEDAAYAEELFNPTPEVPYREEDDEESDAARADVA